MESYEAPLPIEKCLTVAEDLGFFQQAESERRSGTAGLVRDVRVPLVVCG
jgi:hypothetical protein